MVNQLNDQREAQIIEAMHTQTAAPWTDNSADIDSDGDGWEHAGRCPACGVDELDSLYDDLSGDTAYLCAHCGYHAVTAWEVQP